MTLDPNVTPHATDPLTLVLPEDIAHVRAFVETLAVTARRLQYKTAWSAMRQADAGAHAALRELTVWSEAVTVEARRVLARIEGDVDTCPSRSA